MYNIVETYPSTSTQQTTMNASIATADAATANPVVAETNALYVGLFDRPADPSGQTYWATLHGNSSTALSSSAADSMSAFATYNGAALSSSNIASEIVNVYADLLGTTVTASNAGVQYWASQSTYDGGTMSIGQIVASMYNAVEAYSSTNTEREVMQDKLGIAQTYTAGYVLTGNPSSYAGATTVLNDYTQANVQSGILSSLSYSGNSSSTPTAATAAPSSPSAPKPLFPSSYPTPPSTYTTVTLAGGPNTYADANHIFNIGGSSNTAETLVAGYGYDNVNIASGNNVTNTITLGHTTAGAGNDVINSAGTGAITATLGTSGGSGSTGNDTISMTGGNTAADTFTISSTGTDIVSMTGASTAGNTVTINGGSHADTVYMVGGNTAANTVIVNGGSGDVNVTMTGGNSGTNSITISGSGTDTVWVGQGDHTINLSTGSGNAGTTGPVAISIGQGANTIALGTGPDSINMTTAYTTSSGAGANILTGVITGDTLIFNQSAITAAATLVTTTTGTTQTTLDTAGSHATIPGEITYLQGIDTTAGYTTVGLITDSIGTAVVMNHALTSTTWVDQVLQIAGAASYLTASTVVGVNAAHYVGVAL
jgi:hypothetical protein